MFTLRDNSSSFTQRQLPKAGLSRLLLVLAMYIVARVVRGGRGYEYWTGSVWSPNRADAQKYKWDDVPNVGGYIELA
jgi:hypothetical protein